MDRTYVAFPKCKTCGKPVASLETEYCPDCQEKTHFFTSGRAVFLYEKEIRKSVYQFKFHNKREYAGFYVSEMERVEMRSALGIRM